MALGAIVALKGAGKKAGDVKIVSIDGTKGAVQGIIDGWIYSVIESNPRFGPLAFETATKFFNGEPIPEDIIIPTGSTTRATRRRTSTAPTDLWVDAQRRRRTAEQAVRALFAFQDIDACLLPDHVRSRQYVFQAGELHPSPHSTLSRRREPVTAHPRPRRPWRRLLAMAAATLAATAGSVVATSAPALAFVPKTPPLTTPWTNQVSTTNPLPEYPRPQLTRPDWQSLNGIWQFAGASNINTPPVNQNLGEEILVPYPIESALSGIMRRQDYCTTGAPSPSRPAGAAVTCSSTSARSTGSPRSG